MIGMNYNHIRHIIIIPSRKYVTVPWNIIWSKTDYFRFHIDLFLGFFLLTYFSYILFVFFSVLSLCYIRKYNWPAMKNQNQWAEENEHEKWILNIGMPFLFNVGVHKTINDTKSQLSNRK